MLQCISFKNNIDDYEEGPSKILYLIDQSWWCKTIVIYKKGYRLILKFQNLTLDRNVEKNSN